MPENNIALRLVAAPERYRFPDETLADIVAVYEKSIERLQGASDRGELDAISAARSIKSLRGEIEKIRST